MPDAPEPQKRKPLVGRTRCFLLIVCFAGVAIWLVVGRENAKRESLARQIADARTGCIFHPDPRLLDDLAQDTECAGKLTKVQLGEMFPPNYSANRYMALKKFPNLKTIFVCYTGGADAFLDDIKGMTSLEELSFYHAGISAAGARHLASFPNLKRLNLYDRAEPVLDVLKNDRRIEELSFGGKITPARVALLITLPNLRVLTLRVELQDRGSLDLRGLGKLEGLSLSGDGATDDALAGVEQMPNLTSLILNESMVTDAGLRHLTNLTALQTLDLHETHISDDGLKHLVGLTRLRKLDLRDTRVTDGGVNQFQQTLPNCEIER